MVNMQHESDTLNESFKTKRHSNKQTTTTRTKPRMNKQKQLETHALMILLSFKIKTNDQYMCQNEIKKISVFLKSPIQYFKDLKV